MKKVVVIAPHPDDETLGCGGTLLRHRASGDEIHWIIVTSMQPPNFSTEKIRIRKKEVEDVADKFDFSSVHQLGLPTTCLNSENLNLLIKKISDIFVEVQPEVVYAPFYGDVHTDHYWVFRAVLACSKSFRYPSIKKFLCYEVLSETEFGITHSAGQFHPQTYVDVSGYLQKKVEIMKMYKSEIGVFPNPRSEESIEALAKFRGSSAGVQAAEGFQLIKEII